MVDLPAWPPGPAPVHEPAEVTAAPVRPAPVVAADEELLACGARIPDLVDQIDAGRLEPADAHQGSCPYCRSALRDAATSGRALDLLREDRGPAPAGLVDRVLHEVRRTRGTTPVLDLPVAGVLQVAGGVRVHLHVLAGIARAAAAGQPGVTVARSSVAAGRDDSQGGGLQVALGLLVDGRTPLPVLASRLRRAVRGALRHATGLQDVHVDLSALDLVAPGPQLSASDGVQVLDIPYRGNH